MNAIVKVEQKPLLQAMADKYQLEPEQFARTVRATCGMPNATPEQFAAFLIVAKTYDLNPVLREIWAFPSRGGGIVPIVSVDGWINLVNSKPQCDGFEFAFEFDESGDMGCTCKIYRKDRSHPVAVTEWLSECSRPTDPWKMKRRMLRHKAFIQAARLAFGFAGIYDEDEGRTIAEAKDVMPERQRVPSPSEVEQISTNQGENITENITEGPHGRDKYRPGDEVKATADPITSGPQPEPEKPKAEKAKSKLKWPDLRKDYEKWMRTAFTRINEHTDGGALETFWNEELEHMKEKLLPPDFADLISCYDSRQEQIKEDGNGD